MVPTEPSTSAVVPEFPVAAAHAGQADVRYFIPDGSPPSSDALVPAMPQEQMSEETKSILASLPADALPRKMVDAPPATKGDFAIRRATEPAPFATSSESIPEAKGESSLKINVKPQSIDLNYELEKAYNALVNGDTEGAIRIYEDVLSINPNDRTALFGLATTYHRIGLIDQARPIYGRLLQVDPYNVEALNNFFALVGAEAPHAAIEQLELLALDNPEFAPVQAQLALLYQKTGNMERAVEHMSRAASLSPENLAYKYNLAVLYDTKGDAPQAARLYRYLLNLQRDGQELPASPKAIQERLTFLASN